HPEPRHRSQKIQRVARSGERRRSSESYCSFLRVEGVWNCPPLVNTHAEPRSRTAHVTMTRCSTHASWFRGRVDVQYVDEWAAPCCLEPRSRYARFDPSMGRCAS